MRYFRILRRQWFLALLFALFAVGFEYPGPGLWVKERFPFVVKTAVMAALFLTSYGLAGGAILKSLSRVGALGMMFFTGFAVTPVLAWGMGRLLWGEGSELSVGLIIMSAMPCTLASAVIWTRLAGGNDALALAGTISTNLLSFLVAPAVFRVFLGTALEVRAWVLMENLFLTLVVPIAAGQLARFLGRELADRTRRPLSVVNRGLVLLMVWLSVCRAAGGASVLTAMTLVSVAAACLAVHSGALGAAWAAGWRMNRADRIALAVAGSQKTLIVALYVLEDFFPKAGLEVVPVLFFHAIQLVVDSVMVEVWSRGTARSETAKETAA